MKPEQLVVKLKEVLGDGLESVILYGSAAAGDHLGGRSDYNILVVAKRLGVPELMALSSASVAWMKAGNPLPLYFTLEGLKSSADVFPIEILDMKESHRTLTGTSILDRIEVSRKNLRLELEREFKSKLLVLREGFLRTEGKPAKVIELMIQSISTFLVLLRASLRLFQDSAPAIKLDAMSELTKHIAFDPDALRTVELLKEGKLKAKGVDALELFGQYLRTIEQVIAEVDRHIHPENTP